MTLTASLPGEIRYTLDGQKPTAKSTLYSGPVKVANASANFQAASFAADC